MLIAFFDFESSDLPTDTSRITDLAFSVLDTVSGLSLSSVSSLLHDQSYEPISRGASELTGITDEVLKEYGNSPVDVIPQMLKVFDACDFIAGHNINNFDKPLLKAECERYGLTYKDWPSIDTRTDIKFPERIETRKLSYLLAEHGVVLHGAHGAAADVYGTIVLFKKYPLEETIERSKSPTKWFRGTVSFDDKEKAKARKFIWDGKNKWWVKQIKACDFEEFSKTCDFPVVDCLIDSYTGP